MMAAAQQWEDIRGAGLFVAVSVVLYTFAGILRRVRER